MSKQGKERPRECSLVRCRTQRHAEFAGVRSALGLRREHFALHPAAQDRDISDKIDFGSNVKQRLSKSASIDFMNELDP